MATSNCQMSVMLFEQREGKFMKLKVVLAATVLSALGVVYAQGPGGGNGRGRGPAPPGLALSSPDFEDGAVIPNKYTQADPMPVSPKLEWKNVPANTQSFVLLMHDPDVAMGKKTD